MPIVKEERIGGQRLILGDCLQVMPTLGRFDAVVTDPPYGIGEASGKAKTRKRAGNAKWVKDYGSKEWDNQTCEAEIALARSIAKWQVIFGGNYYDLPPTKCWLVWDKLNGETDFADCELAWTNLPQAVRRIKFLWNGWNLGGNESRGDHPTQKPIEVMRWCITHLKPPAETILDPFMGSGTTLVACQKLGRKGTGIELDPEYFEIACRRVDEAARQPDLFVQPTEKPEQEAMDL